MTRTLVPMGYQLAIQVEMEDLTIGGLCMGLGMETNSHIYGTRGSFDCFEDRTGSYPARPSAHVPFPTQA